MQTHQSRVVCLVLFLMTTAVSVATPEGVIWPLASSTRYLTSNFMEYRPGRFHAGLDLKTATVTGFVVRAVEDGWISRVRATPGAYGRAVYLRGDSGRTYVYAHLERFNDVLQRRVRQNQSKTGSYRTQLQFAPSQIVIKQGEVIGLSGQSGTGGPHLHFEVRDAQNRPVDPQSVGFAVGDTIPPVIYEVRAWPVRATTVIQGKRQAHRLAADDGLSGGLPSLRVTGPVAFSAKIIERSDIRGHRLEPSLIQLRVDGNLVYSCRNEGFSFAENAMLRLEWVGLPGVRQHWLHRRAGDSLPGREGTTWYLGEEGKGLARGRHLVEILSSDQAGHAVEAHFELVVDDGPHGPMAIEDDAWLAVEDGVYVDLPNQSHVIKLTPFFSEGSPADGEAVPGFQWRLYSRATGDPVMADVVVCRRSLVLTAAQRIQAEKQGLLASGSATEFLAADWPIEASLPVKVLGGEISGQPGRWGLYHWDKERWLWTQKWTEVPSSGAEVALRIDRSGEYALFADYRAPLFVASDSLVVVTREEKSTVPGITQPAWNALIVRYAEDGSGLDAASIIATLDGRRLIVEPDLPRDRILVEFPDQMEPGSHELSILVADRAGQQSSTRITLQTR